MPYTSIRGADIALPARGPTGDITPEARVARDQAVASSLAARSDRLLAEDARNAAASVAGTVGNYDTLAQATAALSSIPANGGVNVLADGANNGFYVRQGSALVRKSTTTLSALDARAASLEAVTDRWSGSEGLVAAHVDSNDMLLWLVARELDGGPPEWVVSMLADRLQPYIGGGGGGGGAAFAPGDRYLANGRVLPVIPDKLRIAGWGSSSMERSAGPLRAMAAAFGADYYDGGDSGVRSQHTAAQFGSIPALLTVSGGVIPASGSVTVSSSNMPALDALKPFTGTLNGVHGTLSSTATTLTFARWSSGDPVAVPANSPFVPEDGPRYWDAVNLFWMGKNNLNGTGAAPLVIEQTDQTYAATTTLIKRALVLGHFVDRDEPAASAERDEIYAVNAAHAALYGAQFVDVQAYVTGSQVWVDMGLSPTQADLANQAIGNIPPSLAADTGHLTPAAYSAIVTHVVRPRLVSLGWYSE